jgi:replication factor C subunit 2/4
MASSSSKTWLEIYRPRDLDSIAQQKNLTKVLRYAFKKNEISHMLFYGPPGTGKTTTAKMIAKKFFYEYPDRIMAEKIYNERVLELNASDERGIKLVRENIKTFAINAMNNYDGVPQFKLIILDEADAMTSDSQYALRRIIETHTETTRFILICNYVAKIIHPVVSRCITERFQYITTPELQGIAERIGRRENFIVTEEFCENLNYIACGDLRKAINLLERCHFIDKHMKISVLNEISGRIEPEYFSRMWDIICSESSGYLELLNCVQDFQNNSYSSLVLLNDLFEMTLKSTYTDEKKSSIINKLSEVDFSLNENACEFIQLIKITTFINNIANERID